MWPDDKEPRFIVTSLRGRQITPSTTAGNTKTTMPLCAQVLDRAYAHRVVREFALTGKRDAAGRSMEAATTLADALNAKDAAA